MDIAFQSTHPPFKYPSINLSVKYTHTHTHTRARKTFFQTAQIERIPLTIKRRILNKLRALSVEIHQPSKTSKKAAFYRRNSSAKTVLFSSFHLSLIDCQDRLRPMFQNKTKQNKNNDPASEDIQTLSLSQKITICLHAHLQYIFFFYLFR